MKIGRSEILELETQLNNLESEIRNLENSIILKDLNKFDGTKNKIILIHKKIKILTKN